MHIINKNLRNNFYENFFIVSNEISPILLTNFLGVEVWNIGNKTWQSIQKQQE